MLELDRKKIEVKIDGQVYNMRMPSYKEAISYKNEIDSVKEDDIKSSECLITYLEKLGLPKSISETLEVEHMTQLLEVILGAKKK